MRFPLIPVPARGGWSHVRPLRQYTARSGIQALGLGALLVVGGVTSGCARADPPIGGRAEYMAYGYEPYAPDTCNSHWYLVRMRERLVLGKLSESELQEPDATTPGDEAQTAGVTVNEQASRYDETE